MKILLVDDHVLIRDAVRGVLRELTSDATVLEASDSRQAMRLIEAHPDLHLILLDLNLPDESGLDLLKKLTDAHLQTRVIVMTAFDLHHARPQNGLLAGWLIKPVNPVELLKLVESVMGPQFSRSDGGAASP